MQKKKKLQSYSEHSSNFFLCMYFSCTIDRGLYEVARPKIKRFSFFFCLWSCCLFLFFFFFFGLFDVCVKQCCPTINRNFILLSCPNKAASQLLLFVLVFICFSFLFLSSLLYLLFFFFALDLGWEEREGCRVFMGKVWGLCCPPAASREGSVFPWLYAYGELHRCPQHGLCMILHVLAALGKR